MPRSKVIITALPLLFCATVVLPVGAAPRPVLEPVPPPTPRVFLLQGEHLHAARERLRSGDVELVPALRRLERDARAALSVGPFAVTDKRRTPPGGDKHDYMSQAPYWWPDPSKPDRLPYRQRDGRRNPEIYDITDAKQLKEMSPAVETLAIAYYFTGEETFAARAALLLRTWFLDEPTRMRPHLRFAQAIPGVNDGRGTGIIETLYLTHVVDAVGLLHGSAHWTAADERGMREWFATYLRWMLDSEHGRHEAAAKNNHGTYYDVQVAAFALFTGETELARRTIEQVPARRIAVQVEADGRQPLELKRTQSWGYSIMNARGLMLLARLGEHVNIDLWHYQPPRGAGGSIRKALEYLTPYATGERKWPHEQITGFRPEAAAVLLHRAARQYPGEFDAALKKLPPLPADAPEHLVGVRLLGNSLESK